MDANNIFGQRIYMSISVSNLTRQYGTQYAIRDISFQIDKAEVVGFLGPNGAGKSTTMKILTGYLMADGGTALVCGMNVSKQAIDVKRKIGYLSEANPLYYDMYIREYLEFIAKTFRIPNQKKRIEEIVDLTGLRAEAHKKTGQLSKGYKQRTGLAAALIHDPEVLILDEPTSGLDPNQVLEIRDIIRQQGRTKTILFSSHILSEVEAVCKRVIIINKGTIVADDSLDNLKQKTTGQSLYIKFGRLVEPHFFDTITDINFIQQADNAWLITGTDLAFVRKQVIEKALQQDIDIVSVENRQNQLEDIFRNLTYSNN